MKNSLEHLPQIKRDELGRIVSAIRSNCDEVEKIILFGSYARGDYKEEKDLDRHRKSGHVSDYDILVITTTKETALNHSLFNEIRKKLKEFKLSADPRILTHDIDALNIKLAEGQYFFSDITKEGIMLFENGKKQLAKKKNLTEKDLKRLARDNFNEWFKSAKSSYEDFESNLKKHNQDAVYLRKAAFHLHQTAESCLKSITLVFTNYCPNEHYLRFIQDDIEKFYPQINDFFKQDSKEDEARVKLLEYAYIGGRYDPDYYISKEDLEILAKDVERLLETTKIICQQEIEK